MKPIRFKKGVMNRTEAQYGDFLEMQKMSGQVLDYRFEGLKLRLADKTFYTPDFFVIYPDRFEFHEVKGGFIRDDANVKLKVAAAMYPWMKFKMCQRKNKQWIIKDIGNAG